MFISKIVEKLFNRGSITEAGHCAWVIPGNPRGTSGCTVDQADRTRPANGDRGNYASILLHFFGLVSHDATLNLQGPNKVLFH